MQAGGVCFGMPYVWTAWLITNDIFIIVFQDYIAANTAAFWPRDEGYE